MGVGTLAPRIQDGKGNQREENEQKTIKRYARGCANRGSTRIVSVVARHTRRCHVPVVVLGIGLQPGL